LLSSLTYLDVDFFLLEVEFLNEVFLQHCWILISVPERIGRSEFILVGHSVFFGSEAWYPLNEFMERRHYLEQKWKAEAVRLRIYVRFAFDIQAFLRI
jgi:hypothetical protein